MQTVTIVCDTQDHSNDQHHECHDGLQGSSSTRIRVPSQKAL
jgi:hypothetical protein